MKLRRPRFELKLLHKGLILVLVPLVIELVFVGTLWKLLDSADAQTRRLQHAKQISSELNELDQLVLEAGKTAALYKYVHAPSLRDQSADVMRRMNDQIALIEQLTNDSAEEHEAFLRIKPATQDIELLAEQTLRKVDRHEALAQVSERDLAKQITVFIGKFKDATESLVKIEKDTETQGSLAEANSRQAIMNWTGFGLAFNVLIALGMAYFFYQELLKRLQVLMDNTHRLARNAPLLPRISGGDEIEHLDEVFHKMASALAEAAEYKKELIAMVSHDLRTPLTSIQTSLALLDVGACGEMPDRAKQEIQVAERSATRLINLINDLLDIEKMEAGKLEMVPQMVDTKSIIEQSVEAVGSFAEQHAIKFNLPSEQFEFEADGERLVQVLVNLLSNAIKFSPDGGTVTLSIVDKDDALEFRVSDQGPGIPEEYRAAIFERFKQVEGITSTKLKGTGLGLAICKAIVQGHNGRIGVDSEVGKGTTFWFSIPRKASIVSLTQPQPAFMS